MTILVTGASGLLGSNLCRRAVEHGQQVRALVRDSTVATPLRDLGVELFVGDVTDPESVLASARGVELVVHTAAVLGNVTQDIRVHEAVNLAGTRNVMEAARVSGVRRTIAVSSCVIFDDSLPVTGEPRFADTPEDTSYSVTKRLAYLDCERRVQDGHDIVTVIPGGIFGPSPMVDRALERSSVNSHFLRALQGAIQKWVEWEVSFSYVDHVCEVIEAAQDGGKSGGIYLAMGDPKDTMTLASALSRFCELAGLEHRIADVPADEIPAGRESEYGGVSLVKLSRRGTPTPVFDNTSTTEALGVMPISFDDGALETIGWLRSTGRYEG